MKKYFIFIFAFLILLLSYIPNLYEASVIDLLPKDRVMIWGEHNYTYDYNVLLSKIRQGQEGRWTVVDKYDNHPQDRGIYLQMLYLLSGKLTSAIHSPVLTYQLMRVIFSFFWVLTIIYLNIYFLKKPFLYLLGIIFSLLASSFPLFYRFENQWWVGSYMNWWQEMDILKRISFVPHATVNYIVIAILSILIYKKKYFPLISLILFVSVFIQPVAALVFFFSWILYHLFEKKDFLDLTKKTVVILIAITLPLLYIKLVTSNYPWKSLTDFDVNHRWNFSLWEYILALGPVFFLGLAGIIVVLIKKEKRLLSLSTWVLGAFLGMLMFKFFPLQSELRFVQTANHIPLAIMSVYFINYLYRKEVKNAVLNLLIVFIISLGLVQTYFSLKSQIQFIHQRAIATLPLVPYPPQVMYPLTDFYKGLIWLEQNTPRSTVVLSKITAGNYIPTYSGNFVYLGHNTETPFFDERSAKVKEFFMGKMREDRAWPFLQKEQIDYIFYGPQEKEEAADNINKYNFLTPVYQTSMVTIFKVIR